MLCLFKESFLPFNMLTVYKSSEKGLFRHLVTTFFAVYSFRKTSPLRPIFFSKYCKVYVDSGNAVKNWEHTFSFWDKCIWIGFVRYSLLLRKNTSHCVNMLTNSVTISHTTKTDLFGMLPFRIDQRIWEKYFLADLSNNLDLLTRWLSISFLTRGFLVI